MEIVVLGTGTSHGIPMIGCDCAVCTSDDPRDQRTRPSIYVEYEGARILVDTPPELRLQCVANGICRVDAVLFTHHHADHVVGLDDLRRFNWLMKQRVPCYGMERTLAALRKMFVYAFDDQPGSPHSRPQLELRPIESRTFMVRDAEIRVVPLMHGPMPVLGFRFGPFAYCTDCNLIPDDSMHLLRDLDVLILDALRKTPHPTHFTLEEAVVTAQRIGAGRTYFTHMTHQLGHAETNSRLPDSIELAYDGMRISL